MFGFYNFVKYVVKIVLRVKFENKSNIPIVILYNNTCRQQEAFRESALSRNYLKH